MGRFGSDSGQTTAEYALVLLAAAAVAVVLITWAKGGSLTAFFSMILSRLIESIPG